MSLELDARPRRGRPPSRNEILRAGRLGGLAADELAERFGTPLYVYDLDVIERQVTTLQAVLPPRVELAYAVKANPALAVVEPTWAGSASGPTSPPAASWRPRAGQGSRRSGS